MTDSDAIRSTARLTRPVLGVVGLLGISGQCEARRFLSRSGTPSTDLDASLLISHTDWKALRPVSVACGQHHGEARGTKVLSACPLGGRGSASVPPRISSARGNFGEAWSIHTAVLAQVNRSLVRTSLPSRGCRRSSSFPNRRG